jgi:predicted alpha/beta-hydrolase family hydrolase
VTGSARLARTVGSRSVRDDSVLMEIATPSGPALVDLDEPDDPAFLLVLTHGANGGVASPDLLAVRAVALELGGAVARVLQPFRLAGLRAPGPEARQDEAWLAVVAALRERLGDLPLVQGGRSNGARVACRTALAASARGVVALAFPLHPPGRPERSRAGELRQAGVEVVVVNGGRDPFGVPRPGPGVRVYVLPDEGHQLSREPAQVGRVVARWLRRWTAEPG